MRKKTYDKLGEHSGYVKTESLLAAGFTNRQIGEFVEEARLEKICHGYYWVRTEGNKKPDVYKAIETCLSDSRAVICADSACFYQGLIPVEPGILSVATRRDDRSSLKLSFPIRRHYYSQNIFKETYCEITTDFGNYNVFDIDTSVCDCMRFRKDIDTYIFELIIENYRKSELRQLKRLRAYAEKAHVLNEVRKYF